MHRTTPLQLGLLFAVYVSRVAPELPTDTHKAQFNELVQKDMIEPDCEGGWLITDRGSAYVHHILSTPFPEKQYVVVRDDLTATPNQD